MGFEIDPEKARRNSHAADFDEFWKKEGGRET